MSEATLIACLTPPGRSALATLAMRGPCAWQIARHLFHFHSGRPLPDSPRAGRFWLGRAGDDVADEIVLAVKNEEPPHLELHCHGGPEVVQFLLDLAQSHGAEPCSWKQFLAEQVSSLEAECLDALAHAPTARTAAILLDQLRGGHRILDQTLQTVETHLGKNELELARTALEPLTKYLSLGRHLTTPWRVVLAGAPNVGKSSLINALAGYQRSIVSPIPGTTRDVVSTTLAIDGWPIEFADTAGLRERTNDLESQGIARTQDSLRNADLVLWVLDASTEPIYPDANTDAHLLVNKIDLDPAWDLAKADALHVSAQTRAGLDALCEAISSWLVPEVPPPGSPIPFTSQLCEVVESYTRFGDE